LDEFLRPELPEALDPPPGDEEDDDTSPRDVGEDQEEEAATSSTFSSSPEDAQIREILRRGVVFEFAA
jgi:hypothetical protein